VKALAPMRRKALLVLALAIVCGAASWAAVRFDWPLTDHVRGMLGGFGVAGIFAALLLWWSPETCDAVRPGLARRYYRELAAPMVAYVVVMLVWKRLLDLVGDGTLRVLVALLPAAIVLWMMRVVVRYVRQSDEMQRRIELESIAIAAMLVSSAYMAAGFLQTAKLIDVPAKVAMLWVFPMLCMAYGVVKVVIARRYS